jgi:hypothetical protein
MSNRLEFSKNCPRPEQLDTPAQILKRNHFPTGSRNVAITGSPAGGKSAGAAIPKG